MDVAENLIQVGTTLGAVVLGFILGQIADWFKSAKARKEKVKSLRTLIDLEVARNISQVSSYWNKILMNNDGLRTEAGDFKPASLAKYIVTNPFPVLSLIAWRANLGEIASAYTVKEMEKLWKLQDNLEHLSLLYKFFIEANAEKNETARFAENKTIGIMVGGLRFSELVSDHAQEFKNMIESILAYKK